MTDEEVNLELERFREDCTRIPSTLDMSGKAARPTYRRTEPAIRHTKRCPSLSELDGDRGE